MLLWMGSSRRKVQSDPQLRGLDAADVDVPAAVLCTSCGGADCPGCEPVAGHSGVVAVVPWERTDVPMFRRLWETARLATADGERFFERLPDGSVAVALRFAVLAEATAAGAMGLVALVGLTAVAPRFVLRTFSHALAEAGFGRLLVLGLPMVAALMVAAHAVHGVAVHVGATRTASSPTAPRSRVPWRQGLRFGLYACGWDLVLGPVGLVVRLAGRRRTTKRPDGVPLLGVGIPTRSTLGFLRGAYGLHGERAQPALRTGHAAAAVATLGGAVLTLGWITAMALLG